MKWDGDKIEILKKSLNQNESFIRHIFVKVEQSPRTSNKVSKWKKIKNLNQEVEMKIKTLLLKIEENFALLVKKTHLKLIIKIQNYYQDI